jgi:hypothetical protein
MYWIEYKLLAFPTGLPEAYTKICGPSMSIGRLNRHEGDPGRVSALEDGIFILTRGGVVQNLPIDKPLAPLLMWLSLIGAARQRCQRRNGLFATWRNLWRLAGYLPPAMKSWT